MKKVVEEVEITEQRKHEVANVRNVTLWDARASSTVGPIHSGPTHTQVEVSKLLLIGQLLL
jgi:hypothetical protein